MMNADELRKKAEELLEGGKGKAEEILEDGGKMDQLLEQVENKLETVPKAGEFLAGVPLMIALLKDYIQKEGRESVAVLLGRLSYQEDHSWRPHSPI